MSTIADVLALDGVKLLTNAEGSGRHTGRWDVSGRQASLVFQVPWAKNEEFLQLVAGVPQLVGGGIVRNVPLQYPFNSRMFATSVNYQGVGADHNVSTSRPYTRLNHEVTFSSLPFGTDDTTAFVSMEVKGSGNFITVPGHSYTFAGNGEQIEQDIGRLVHQIEITVTKHFCPSLPQQMALFLTYADCVSSQDVVFGPATFPAGTLYFPSWAAQAQTTVFGLLQCQVTASLLYRAIPWNSAVRHDGTVDEVSPAPYPTADLNGLLYA